MSINFFYALDFSMIFFLFFFFILLEIKLLFFKNLLVLYQIPNEVRVCARASCAKWKEIAKLKHRVLVLFQYKWIGIEKKRNSPNEYAEKKKK